MYLIILSRNTNVKSSIGTAAVSKDRLRVVVEPDKPDVLSRSVESVVALGYQNLIQLEWNEPFTSDDPASLKYNVSIANNKDQHQQVFRVILNTTSTNLPTEIMSTCCNHTIAVTAFTESHTANKTTLEVDCFGCKLHTTTGVKLTCRFHSFVLWFTLCRSR